MSEQPKRVSLNQPAVEDHAAKVMREKIGDPRSLSRAAEKTFGAAIELAAADQQPLVDKIIAALRTVFDPEIPLNVYDLGLIYKIALDPANAARVEMTLTAPGCPVAGVIVADVRRKIEAIPEVPAAQVELVWTPAWSRERLSEEALLELGML
jgi:FeS assembly SUF system protein